MKIMLRGDGDFRVIDVNYREQTRPPVFPYGRVLPVVLELYHDDNTPYDEAELNQFATWQFGVDADYLFSTEPAVLTISDFVVTGNTIAFIARTDTIRFKDILGNNATTSAISELKGYLPGETLSSFGSQFKVQLRNAVVADGSAPPPANPDLYYTAAQIQSLLLNKVNKDFSGYTEKTALVDADAAVLNDSEDSGNIKRFSLLSLWNYVKGKADAAYSAIVHTHAISDVTGLQTSLDGKQDTLGFTPEDSANKGAVNGYASLGADGKVPVSQMPTVSKGYIVADIAARDVLELTEVCAVRVIDATADATVDSGGATYWYDPAGPAWYKSAEDESMDLILQWENIQGKPTCSVADIEDAVAKKHSHTNAATLNAIPDHSTAEAGTAPVKQADGSILWAVVSGGSGGSENIITKSITDADLDANGEKVFTWSALAITAAPIMAMLDNDGNDIECPILTNSTAENITINLQAIRDDNGGTLPGTYTLVIYAPADSEGFAQSITDAALDANKQYIVTWSTLQITGFTVTQVNDNTGLKASIPLQWDTANEQITLDFSAACSANGGTLPGTFLFLGGRSGEYVDVSGKADKVGAEDLEITDAAKGLILRSPNGTRFRITIDDNGTLTTEDLTA